MMIINIYQAVAKTKYILSKPIFSPKRIDFDPNAPWLGAGYYFWEHKVENAIKWGNTRYCGNYSIYGSAYLLDNDKCLDFAGSHDDIEQLKTVYNHLISMGIPQQEVTIDKIVGFILDMLKWQGIKLVCTRLKTKPFLNEKTTVRTPNNYYLSFPVETIQVCFYDFPNELILKNYTLLSE